MKYNVDFYFKIRYKVEAESEEEAEDKAISLFEDDDISGDIEWDTPDIIEVSEDE